MDEHALAGAVLNSRKAYETLLQLGCNAAEFTETARVVFDCAGEQYQRDVTLASADRNLLRAQVERRFGKGSMADSVMEFAASLPSNSSGTNVAEEYRLLRLHRAATTLATLLASGQHGDETQQTIAN
jgi:hypothetical protein